MDIRPISGMGEGKPVRQCDWCDRDLQGRTAHLIHFAESNDWVCDRCYAGWRG